MPKLNRPPKYCKVGKYAAVYHNGKTHYLGLYGSPESKVAYSRLVAEIQANPTLFLPSGEKNVTVKELAADFLDHAKATLKKPNYTHHRIVIADFLLKLYGDDTTVNEFKPACLKLIREHMIQSHRFCRNMINDYVSRIVRIFAWGLEEGIVHSDTVAVLKAVKPLSEGYVGTFDHEEREDVPDSVIRATLSAMPPTLAAMVKLQRLTGCRPSEIFNMRVGQIDKHSDPDLWLYRLASHKTQKKTKRKKVIPLGKPEQELILPYLTGKKPSEAVFSPRTAQAERCAEKRANRKTKLTPSQEARDAERAAITQRYSEFYNKDSYRQAVDYAIKKANKSLPEEEQIPLWTPYQIRHTAATVMELEAGFDEAQTLLDHERPDTTARYTHGRLKKLKELARNRRDPFAECQRGDNG